MKVLFSRSRLEASAYLTLQQLDDERLSIVDNQQMHLSIKAKISQHSDLDDKPPGSLRDGRHRTPSAPLCLLDPLKACKRTFVYIKFGQKENKSIVLNTQST